MKKHTVYLGWSALFVFVAILFVPSIVSFTASAQDAEPAPERCVRAVPNN